MRRWASGAGAFSSDRIRGLYDELRPGRPRSIDDERIAGLISKLLKRKPKDGATHWSTRAAAAETGISKSSVHRYLNLFGLKPHRTESFKLSTDAFFIEKLRDVVGLYLNPPENALVLCVDEKSQVQALERTQPMLPMGFGYVEGVTHDYKRHGTTTLFAALDVLNGTVLTDCKPRHRHQEFLAFLRSIEAAVPAEMDVHLIVDNYSTHTHAKVKAWLAKRPRWHLHFIPTYSSWLNLVERFFALITDKAIRRGSFRSVPQLVGQIDHFVTRLQSQLQTFHLDCHRRFHPCKARKTLLHESAGQDTSNPSDKTTMRWANAGAYCVFIGDQIYASSWYPNGARGTLRSRIRAVFVDRRGGEWLNRKRGSSRDCSQSTAVPCRRSFIGASGRNPMHRTSRRKSMCACCGWATYTRFAILSAICIPWRAIS